MTACYTLGILYTVKYGASSPASEPPYGNPASPVTVRAYIWPRVCHTECFSPSAVSFLSSSVSHTHSLYFFPAWNVKCSAAPLYRSVKLHSYHAAPCFSLSTPHFPTSLSYMLAVASFNRLFPIHF